MDRWVCGGPAPAALPGRPGTAGDAVVVAVGVDRSSRIRSRVSSVGAIATRGRPLSATRRFPAKWREAGGRSLWGDLQFERSLLARGGLRRLGERTGSGCGGRTVQARTLQQALERRHALLQSSHPCLQRPDPSYQLAACGLEFAAYGLELAAEPTGRGQDQSRKGHPYSENADQFRAHAPSLAAAMSRPPKRSRQSGHAGLDAHGATGGGHFATVG